MQSHEKNWDTENAPIWMTGEDLLWTFGHRVVVTGKCVCVCVSPVSNQTSPEKENKGPLSSSVSEGGRLSGQK